VDPTTQQRYDSLNEEVSNAINEVDTVLELDDEQRELVTYGMVEALVNRYREFLATLAGNDRTLAEGKLGKRVTDLRRTADKLSKRASGSRVAMAKDSGFVPFLEQRQPPKSIEPQRANPLLSKTLNVGAAIDAWCGKCKEIREHHIVAVVSDEPKQVICQACNSRHNYRAEPPARAKNAATAAAAANPVERRRIEDDRKSQERQDARRTLQKELLEAENPRPFDPKGRYKAGEIIVHAEHGRGKIENVLRSSMDCGRWIYREHGLSFEGSYGRTFASKLIQDGQCDQAIAEATKSIALEADNPEHYLDRATALSQLGRDGEAVPDLRRALELDVEVQLLETDLVDDAFFSALLAAARALPVEEGCALLASYRGTLPEGRHLADADSWSLRLRGQLPTNWQKHSD
jgi:tetratricopeptide (TPR) repeat protein